MYRKNPQNWMKHLDFVIFDILSLHIAFVLAYMTRQDWHLPYESPDYASLLVLLTLVDFVLLTLSQNLSSVVRRGLYREFTATSRHCLTVGLVGIAYLFGLKVSTHFSRIVLGLFLVYYILIDYILRILWKQYLQANRKNGTVALYLITTCDRAEDAVRRYLSCNQYQMKGVCLLDLDQTGEQIQGVPINATRDTVLQHLCREWVDEVVLSFTPDANYPTGLLDQLVEMGLVVHVELDCSSKLEWQWQEAGQLAGKMVLSAGISGATPLQLLAKRTMDIAGGLVGCLITCLLTLVIGPLIYLNSPGPIFFAQTRVGKNGKRFKMYKFRSMYMDAEERKAELMAANRVEGGLMFKLDYDPRIIGSKKLPDGTVKKGIGNFIRDWSLDEFPQFFNCLKGELSLVGTRPPTVDEWERYDTHHRARLAIKPGITGLWQVSGRSKITDFEQVVALDKKYIREWSIGLDIRILLKTVKAVLDRDGSM